MKTEHRYKATISIIFGLLGFAVNFFTINFAFSPYTATVLIGLLFPMLITLAWGWKYGALSALAGGCQAMWWLWGPSNGYATFLVVPPFTLWIIWHGFIANLRRKKEHRWWRSAYIVEIPFRDLSTINLYTLSRWAITLNPQQRLQAETLRQVAGALNTSLDCERVLQLILEQLARVVDYDSASVMLVSGGVLETAAHQGFRSEKQSFTARPVGDLPHVQQALESHLPVIIPDTAADPRWMGRPESEHIRGWLGVPLVAQERVIGLLNLDKEQPGFYTPRHAELATAFTNQAAVAIQNAQLYQQAQQEIAERARVEAELERSNTELEQFAYVVSHDLQEPLRMVKSYAQLLARRYKGKLDADADDFIGYAVEGATRMQTLINGLLACSRIRTRSEDFTPADCETILERTLDNLQVAIEESGAVITHDPLPTVTADAVQLGQLFQNLIGNAIKFHGAEPPRIHISAQRIKEYPTSNPQSPNSPCATTTSASSPTTLSASLGSFNACTPGPSISVPALDWRSARGLWNVTAAASG